MTNILYDGDAFIIHQVKHRYPDMVFKLHASGLHVLDTSDLRSFASYTFVETVVDNMSLFTKSQIASANQAHDLQAGLAYLSVSDLKLKWIVKASLLKNSPVMVEDINVALKIWGPSVALLKGKTVRCKAPVVIQDILKIPT